MSAFVRVTSVLALALSALAFAQSSHNTSPVTFPLAFEANHGQTSSQVRYLARSHEGTLFFTDSGVTIAVPRVGAFRMLFDRAAATPSITAEQPMSSRSNYIYPDRHIAISGIENFGALRYAQIYPGIDVRFYGHALHLEHEFDLAPHADASHIALRLEGASATRIAANGDAELTLGVTTLRESAPIAWQTINTKRVAVKAQWNLLATDRLGIALGDYDHSQPVYIDPVLAYSTHLGGNTSPDLSNPPDSEPATTTIESIVVDAEGNIFVAGNTTAADFPTTAGAFNRNPNGFQSGHEDGFTNSGFISKFDKTGRTLIFSTFLRDNAPMIAVDTAGHVYSAKGGFDNTGGPTDGSDPGTALDKLSADGSQLLFSTHFGATPPNAPTQCFNVFNMTRPGGMSIDNSGHVWLAGSTDNPCIKMSATAFQKTAAVNDTNGWIAKFDTNKAPASSIVFATYLGGNHVDQIAGIAIDSSGNSYVTGQTGSTNFPHGKVLGTAVAGETPGFVAKVNATGSGLLFSTLIHGVTYPVGSGKILALDSAHNTYIAGVAGAGFPTTAGAFQRTVKGFDGFVLKLNAAGNTILFSTLLGGSGTDQITALAINNAGMPFVVGNTNSADFPTTSNAFQPKYVPGAQAQAFVTAFNANGQSLYYSTLLGGTTDTGAGAVFVDPAWNAFVGGFTADVDYPITPDAFQKTMAGAGDAFLAKVVIASDLNAGFSENTGAVTRGGTVTQSLNIVNAGPDGADNVVLTDAIPAGASFAGLVSAGGTSCSVPAIGATAGTLKCTKSHMNSGTLFSVVLKLKAIGASGSTVNNKFSVSSKMQDLNPGNNTVIAAFKVR
jgi:uncharacterized repeat protein (TIGR01451 family)